MKNLQNYIDKKHRLKDHDYMELALEVATQAKSNGNLPIAAVLVWAGGLQLVEHDTRYADRNSLNHAIINVLNKAADTLGRKKLSEAVLYSTIEPNVMCAMAIKSVGIKEVVFGVHDKKDGFISSGLLADHTLLDITVVGGVLGERCREILPQSMQEYTSYEY